MALQSQLLNTFA